MPFTAKNVVKGVSHERLKLAFAHHEGTRREWKYSFAPGTH
jgi:hypothetical protein